MERKVFVQTEVELVEGIEAYRVATSATVRMVDVRKAEDGVAGESEDRILQGNEILIARDLDALIFGDDRVAGEVGALNQQRADLLEAVGRVSDVDGKTAASAVDRRNLPASEHLLHHERSVAAEPAALAVGQIVDDGEDVV